MIIAAPTPWTARNPTSAAALGAAPQQTLASGEDREPDEVDALEREDLAQPAEGQQQAPTTSR